MPAFYEAVLPFWPDRLTSKATKGPSVLNGDGSMSAFCKDAVLGDFCGRLRTAALEVAFRRWVRLFLWGCRAELFSRQALEGAPGRSQGGASRTFGSRALRFVCLHLGSVRFFAV